MDIPFLKNSATGQQGENERTGDQHVLIGRRSPAVILLTSPERVWRAQFSTPKEYDADEGK